MWLLDHHLYLPRQCHDRLFHSLHNLLDKVHTLPDQLQHSDNSHQESKCHLISTDLNRKRQIRLFYKRHQHSEATAEETKITKR